MAKTSYTPIEITNNVEDILGISRTAVNIMKENHGIEPEEDGAIPTVSYVFLSAAWQHIAANKHKAKETGKYSIDIMGMIEMGITYREDPEGEKDGNYTPFVQAGELAKLFVKDDNSTEEQD